MYSPLNIFPSHLLAIFPSHPLTMYQMPKPLETTLKLQEGLADRLFFKFISDSLFSNFSNNDTVWVGLVNTLKEALKNLSSSPLYSCSGEHHHLHHLLHHDHHLHQGGCDWPVLEAVECSADSLTLYGFNLTIYIQPYPFRWVSPFLMCPIFWSCLSCLLCHNS